MPMALCLVRVVHELTTAGGLCCSKTFADRTFLHVKHVEYMESWRDGQTEATFPMLQCAKVDRPLRLSVLYFPMHFTSKALATMSTTTTNAYAVRHIDDWCLECIRRTVQWIDQHTERDFVDYDFVPCRDGAGGSCTACFCNNHVDHVTFELVNAKGETC
ncbi:hypothetical protein B0I35DRAFT_413471 [Stachybotrys elegans]|uniref:Uncharacterized protein n=1 Tax=Stachybotrys elegans TaxID=80388 RepID=A0A8K0WL30_9HYPO|nr:hypothetical protein B0I35DRAFT_413471 [Stachybotrys elegans]